MITTKLTDFISTLYFAFVLNPICTKGKYLFSIECDGMWLLQLIATSLTVLTYFICILYFISISNALCTKGECLFGMNVVVVVHPIEYNHTYQYYSFINWSSSLLCMATDAQR